MGVPEGETGPPLAVGTVVAERFRIVGRVGEGGMGEVYIADQLGMDRRVALKLVRPSLAGDEAMLDRFRREARAASRIKSRNVVTVYDFGRDTTTGRLFIAMELLEGETLASRIERAGAIGTVEALRITAEVCLALDAAHRAGVVHRDLKPENVFVEHDGNVKVLDFGIARILDPGGGEGSSKATITATFVGTPAYISPEAAARNKSRPVGPASDLYSLGVMLFEMLTGRLPFDDDEPMILIGMHLRAPPERLSDVLGAGAVPDALDVLVDDLLAKEPESRPDGARAVIDRLRVTSDSIDAALPRPSQADTTGDQRPFAPAQLPSSTPGPGDLEPSSRVPTPQPMELSGSHTAARARLPRAQVAAAAIGAASLLLATGVAVAIWATGVGSHSAPVAERPVAQPPVEPPPTTMSPAPSPLPPATTIEPAPTRTVRISFEVSPRTARVEVDGTRVTGSTLELPGNGSTHRAVAISGARRSPDVEFVADADRVVRLVVRRRGRAASHEPPPTESTAASSRRGGLLGLIHDEE